MKKIKQSMHRESNPEVIHKMKKKKRKHVTNIRISIK